MRRPRLALQPSGFYPGVRMCSTVAPKLATVMVVPSQAQVSAGGILALAERFLGTTRVALPERVTGESGARSGGVDRFGFLAGAGCDKPSFVGEGDELRAVVAV